MQQFTQAWLTLVIDISIKSILLAGVAGLALCLLRVRDTNLRHRVWTAVLLGMLAMPALVYVTPAVPLPGWLTRMIPSSATTGNSIAEQTDTPHAVPIEKNLPGPADETPNPLNPAALVKSTGNELSLPAHGALPVPPLADLSTANSIAETHPSLESPVSGALNASRLSLILAGLYFLVAIVLLGRLLLGLTLTHRLTRQAREIHLSTPLSLPRRRNLRLLESAAVHVPATVGCMRPVVLLPRCWPQWSEAKLQAVLAHELAHLERADWLVITLAELNRAVYWFHPLAWFVRNRLSELAEQNCDDAVLAADGDRTQYARYLLEVAGSLAAVGTRYRPPRQSVAMARKANVETRIEAILDVGRPLARRLGVWGIACLIAIGIPAILLAAALRASTDDASNAAASSEMKSAAKSDEAGKQQPAASPQKDYHVHGRVVGPNGQPVAGATVFAGWTLMRRAPPSWQVEHKIVAQTKANAEGNYELTFSSALPDSSKMTIGWQIAALAPGFGPAWRRDIQVVKDIEAKAATNLALTKDSPVRGRVVDLEGKPLAGVQVRLNSLRPAESEQAIADWIQDAKEKSPPGNINQYFSSSSGQMTRRSSPFPGEFPTIWENGRLEHLSPALPDDVTTDSEGHFEFKQLGENRLAILEIERPGIAKSMLHVVNRDMQTVFAKPQENNGVRAGVYYGRDFQFVAEPAQAIVGAVTDAETGKPLANLEVHLEQFAGNVMAQRDFLVTRTDEHGHYRLEGAPQGGGHRIEATPAVDQPYFPTAKNLAAATGLEPISCDFALRKGQWIVGKVTDSQSGEPVGEADVEYLPLRTNEEAKNFPNYRPEITGSAPSNRFRTAADGSFRVLAIPGAGILAAIAPNPRRLTPPDAEKRPVYVNLTKNSVPESLVTKNGTLTTYLPWVITGYHALRQIDLAKSDDNATYDLQFDRGAERKIKLVDSDGQPVTGVRVLGQQFPPQLGPPQAEAVVKLIGLRPNDERDVVCIHPQRRIGKAAVITSAEETTVTLEPCSIVRGRVVDEDKKPVGGLNIGVSLDHPDNWHRGLDGTITDDDGRFEVLLPPGTKYRVSYYAPNGKPIREISAECEAKPGVVFELGNLANGTRLTAEETEKLIAKETVATNRSATVATSPSGAGGFTGTTTITAINLQPPMSDSSQPTQANGISAEPIQVTGHVLDERGAAVANVRVIATQSRWIDQQYLHTEHRQVAETRSRADGSFAITVPPLKPVDYNNRQLTFDWKPATIMAIEPGRISSWVGGGEFPNPAENPFAGDLVLHLDRYATPIQGRLVSLEGQPLSGLKVVVKMMAIAKPKSVEPWLAVAEQKRRDGSLPPLKSGAGTLTLSSFSNAMVWDSSMNSASSSSEPKWSPYYPMISRLLPQHPQLSTGAKTNAEGRFEIGGLPADSLAVLEISGPGVETHTISVINREFQRLDVPGTGFTGAESNAYYGAKFDHPVPPGVSLVGTVTDKESAKPIVGAQVSASVIENQMLRNQSQWTNVSGPNGEYRIDGLPLGGKKELEVVPAAEQPYLVAKGLEAPEAAAGKPGSMEIKLRRGVLVHGRVTDAETGAPVKAVVQYNPLLSNEQARDFGYDPQIIRFDPGDDRQHTGADGVYHTVVIPGQGILSVRCDQWNDYCVGLGGEKMEVTADGRFATYNLTGPKAFNAVAQIDVPANTKSIERDLKVSRGINLKVNVRDPQGQPLKGVLANGLRPFGSFGDAPASEATLEFIALRPGETRRVMLLHRDRHLGQILELTAPEKGGAPEARTVTLEPCGTVTGRIVNGQNEPVAGVQLTAFAGTPRNFDALAPQQVATDADGKFRFDVLPPGALYNISGFSPQFNAIEVAKELKLAPGETVDFGTIDVSSKKRPEPTRKQASAGAASSTPVALASTTENGPMPAAKDSKRLIVHGRIVGVDGKPAAGADVAAIGMRAEQSRGGDQDDLGAVLAQTKTNSDGAYRLEVAGASSKAYRDANVIARASGTSVAWKKLNLDADDVEAPFEFKPEQAISGRLVDIDGQPAVGVRLKIGGIMVRAVGDQFPSEGVGLFDAPTVPAVWPQPIITDDAGHFTVHGVSKDEGVYLNIEGTDRFAPQSISLNTGMPEQRGERDGTYRPLVKNLKPGEEGVLPLAPAQLFTGTVRFEDTGEPAPKARLAIWASQQNFGSMISVAGKADDKGRYKISPNPGVRFGVTAYPPDGAAYMVRQVEPIAWQSGDRSREVDVKLPRGVLVRGKVLEQGSNMPIAGASIQYVPETANNPNKPTGVQTGWQDIHKSDEQGRFEIVVLPGPGRLLVHGPQNDFVFQESSQRELYQGRAGGQRNYAHGIERIEPAANAEPLEVKFHLKRGGALAGEVVDEQGAAVKEASMLSRLQISPLSLNWRGFTTPVMDGRFELTGLAADQEYPVYFLESKRRLGATLTAKAGMDSPRVVLKQCGDAKMRFVDGDGKPVAGYEPMVQIVVTPGELNLVRLNQNNGTLTADADFIANVDRVNHAGRDQSDREGRLTVPALIPGATYRVVVMRNKAWSLGKELVAKAGETIDLGDITVERPE